MFKNDIINDDDIKFKSQFSIAQVCNTSKTTVQLDNTISFDRCYISSVSVYTDFKLYNVSQDQTIIINANIDEYPSCKNLFYSGINLIKKDDLMHGLDDLRKAVEMLLKDLLHNNLSIERQSQNRIKALLLKNGWKD